MTGKRLIGQFFRDETGATAIEYALIGTLIGVALIATFSTVGNSLFNAFGVGAGGSGDVIADQASKIPGG